MNTMTVSSKKHYRTIVITTALILCLFLSACAPIPRKDQPLVGRWRESPKRSMTFYASGVFIEETHSRYKVGSYTVDGDIFTTVVDGETKSYKYYFRTDGGMHVERYYEEYPDLVGGLPVVFKRIISQLTCFALK